MSGLHLTHLPTFPLLQDKLKSLETALGKAKRAHKEAVDHVRSLEQRLKVLQLEVKSLTTENSTMEEQVRDQHPPVRPLCPQSGYHSRGNRYPQTCVSPTCPIPTFRVMQLSGSQSALEKARDEVKTLEEELAAKKAQYEEAR